MEFVLWLAAGGALGFVLGWGVFAARGAGLRESRAALEKDLAIAQTRLEQSKYISDERDEARREKTILHERAVRLEAEKRNIEQKLKEQQEELRLKFEHMANRIFEEFSRKFTVQSEKKIGDLLHPLRERITEFQKKVDESFTHHGKEQHSLKTEIERIVKVNEDMRFQTESLTKALRGDIKVQGNWGEVMLERILEESGLRPGEDYILQGSDLGLKGEDGGSLRPDVIVKLPDNKHVVIDAKVSLVAYERYCSETDEGLKDTWLKAFLKSVKAHVNGLEQKRYQDADKLGAPDFVLMFLPIEGAYALAMQHERELHSYAWGKKIVIVCPATLFATLKTIASIWRIETQNKYALEIARQGGALYDKFAGLIEDMQLIGKHLERTHGVYGQAMGKLHQGAGNLVGRVENLKKLGAKASKSLPSEMLGDEEDEKVVALVKKPEES